MKLIEWRTGFERGAVEMLKVGEGVERAREKVLLRLLEDFTHTRHPWAWLQSHKELLFILFRESAGEGGRRGERSRTEYEGDTVLRKVWELMEDAEGEGLFEFLATDRVSEELREGVAFNLALMWFLLIGIDALNSGLIHTKHKRRIYTAIRRVLRELEGYLSDALMLKEILESGESERVSEEEAHAILFGDED